ncbi:T9SS type B sorting domain-containing protein [Tenacibaculum ovolyticum]|uniref:T9SS type B sorting domain-containing protein n=1 Tax=Tenacibaculum ovolyticum TaxID=104270 RepID=UPI0022F38B21|nr:T9SS type B sorting domain-containing protein [Tenacibaculum ovolyticum]WBX76311.1 T9SS type B sorting domain-containing protein [Tenacibaculum ovolyticum]
MKKTLLLVVLFSVTKIQAQITLTYNVGNGPFKVNSSVCENNEESWAKTFTLADFGISTTDQFIIRSGQVAISNSYEGAIIIFNIYSIDSDFPNSEPKRISYGNYVLAPEIGDIPEIVQINFANPIVIPSNAEKVLIEVTQGEDIYNPNYKRTLISGTYNDTGTSWFIGCGKYYPHISTNNLDNPIPDANYFINVTGEKLSTINSDSNVNLTHNIGDNPIQTRMFSCTAGYQYWARRFSLSDFGINENEEFIINKGFVGLSGAEWLSTVQFNIYKIDKNFPSSFSESHLIGSSQVEEVPYFGYSYLGAKAKIFLVDFKTPIIIPSGTETILIEVHKGVAYGDGEAFIAGTENDNDDSWYRGCYGDSSNEYRTTKDLWGTSIPEWNDINFYITVNGLAKTILPFEITNNNNCVNLTNNFSLTNQSEIKSVKWNFDDINSGTNNISNSINPIHQFTSSGTYKVSAEVTHIDNTNYIITSEIEIFDTPTINSSVILKQCDNSDINGFSSINLVEAKTKIVSNPENYTITFFEEKALAEINSPNSIPNPTTYTNQIISNDVVWARVENVKGCFRISEVNLVISTTKIPSNFQKSFYICDNGANKTDGIATFDFSTVTQEVKNEFPLNQQLIITYYENQVNALAEENKITDISNYQNTNSPNQQTIYIRVDSALNNDCLGLGGHITLYVDSVPVANPVVINPECDNDRDGLFAFDTSIIQNTIVDSQLNVMVSYKDENGMVLSSPLPNPFVTASQTITARITNTNSQDPNGQCYSETTIDFVVNTVPIANTIPIQEECDDDTDGIFNFDTSTIESTILGNQTGLIVKYFDKNDVELSSPLPNPFTTTTQTIRVRIENPNYGVCYEETALDFIVREKPTVNVIDEDIICMDKEPKLQIGVENPNVNYNYIWKDENNFILGNSATTTITKGGKYTVVATSGYGCNSEEAIINIRESSKSTININDIDVQDDSDNNFIKINTSNLGLGDYEFRLLDSNSNILIDYQENSSFENLNGGNYIIEINDKNGCGSVFFDISLISFPNFFTPNADGRNDTWHIQGIGKSIYKSGTVTIYDRFGKTLKTLNINDTGWNGFYNSKKLPSNDYWFYAELITPKGKVITRKGNFSLIRK